jgi:hypothetical protein
MSTLAGQGSQSESAKRRLVALVAGGLYGSWAGFAHVNMGLGVVLCAGLTQAGLSAISTLFLMLLLARLFHLPSSPVHGFWLAALGAPILAITCLVAGHALAGTPHIALAIAPSVIVGIAGSFAYARALLAQARRSLTGRD